MLRARYGIYQGYREGGVSQGKPIYPHKDYVPPIIHTNPKPTKEIPGHQNLGGFNLFKAIIDSYFETDKTEYNIKRGGLAIDKKRILLYTMGLIENFPSSELDESSREQVKSLWKKFVQYNKDCGGERQLNAFLPWRSSWDPSRRK